MNNLIPLPFTLALDLMNPTVMNTTSGKKPWRRFLLTTMLAAGITTAQAASHEQVDPNRQPQSSAPSSQEPPKQAPQAVASPTPSVATKTQTQSPLADMWEGVLEFFYAVESDSTRTK